MSSLLKIRTRGKPGNNPSLPRLIGPIGLVPDNLQATEFGNGFIWNDRARSSKPWGNDGSYQQHPVVNSNGYPTQLTSDHCESLINASDLYDTDGLHDYVLYCSVPDAGLYYFFGASEVSSEIRPGNIRRSIIRINPANLNKTYDATPLGGYSFGIGINALPTKFRCKADGDAVDDYIRIFKLGTNEEADSNAGFMVSRQAIERWRNFGANRWMELAGTNSKFNVSDEAKVTGWSWNYPIPLDARIEVSNRLGIPMWDNFPIYITDAQVQARALYIKSKLNTGIPYLPEIGNEEWNYGFNAAFTFWYNLRNPKPGAETINYGYRSAQVMAIVRKAWDYSSRVLPILNVQNTNTATTDNVVIGFFEKRAEWGDPTSPNYSPEFYAKFKEPGQVWRGMAPAIYLAAGLDNPNMSDANVAIVESWANDPDGGVAKVIQQLTDGSLLQPNDGNYLNNLVASFAGQIARANKYQWRIYFYEVQAALQQSRGGTRVYEIFMRAVNHPSFRDFMRSLLTEALKIGDAAMIEADIGIGDTPAYGMVSNPFDLTKPRWLGATDVQKNPPAPAPLQVTLTPSGFFAVSRPGKVRIDIRGGRGEPQVKITNAPAGFLYDDFRETAGVFSTEVPVARTMSVEVTTPDGQKKTATLDYTVLPQPTYRTGRYLFANLSNPGDFVDTDYIGIVTPDGVEKAATWTGTGGAANLAAADGTNAVGDPNGTIATGDLGAAVTVAQLVIVRGSNDFHTPRVVTVSIGNQANGSDKVTLFTLNEASASQWQAAGLKRVFEVPA